MTEYEQLLRHGKYPLCPRFSFVSATRFDVGESAICGLRALRGVSLINPQTENGKGLEPLALTQRGFSWFWLNNYFP
jgi:hypothetical protein